MTKINTSGLEYIELSLSLGNNGTDNEYNMEKFTITHIPGKQLDYYYSGGSSLYIPEQVYILFVEANSGYPTPQIYTPQTTYRNSIIDGDQCILLTSIRLNGALTYSSDLSAAGCYSGKCAYGVILMNNLRLLSHHGSGILNGGTIKIYVFPLSNFIKN